MGGCPPLDYDSDDSDQDYSPKTPERSPEGSAPLTFAEDRYRAENLVATSNYNVFVLEPPRPP